MSLNDWISTSFAFMYSEWSTFTVSPIRCNLSTPKQKIPTQACVTGTKTFHCMYQGLTAKLNISPVTF